MAARPPDAFLSYTRFDDQHDGGAISEFRRRLADSVRAVTGESFEIFQDVDGIGLGEHWPGKLDEMLEEAWPAPCRRVLRGGSWNNNPRNVRSANRNRNNTDNWNNNTGFRVASTPSCRSCSVHGRGGRAEVRPGRVMMSRLHTSPRPGAASVLGLGRRAPPFSRPRRPFWVKR